MFKNSSVTTKAIVILNINGFYDYLLKFFEEIISQNFAADDSGELYHVSYTVEDAVEYLMNYKPSDLILQKNGSAKKDYTL